MPQFFPRPLKAGLFFFVCASLFVAVACSSLSPTPPLPSPTILAAALTATASVTSSHTPTHTPTPTETRTPTETATATPSETPTLTPTPSHRAVTGGVPWTKVWFPGDLIQELSKIGMMDPGAIPPRAENINPLTGLVVDDPSLLQRRAVLARLGNDPQARPQAGLNQADLVFEEMIDQKNMVFSVTRLTAVFLGQNATIRPFRSARMVNGALQPMFDGILVHSGASDGTRFVFEKLPWGHPLTRSLNLDDQYYGQGQCTLTSSYLNRMASTVDHIHSVVAGQGLDAAVPLRGFDFSDSVPGGQPVASVALDHRPWPIGTAREFTVEWKYDATSGRWLRFSAGKPFNTAQYAIQGRWGGACQIAGPTTIEQVSAANVIVLDAVYEPTSILEDKTWGISATFIQLTGSGTAYLYRDGVQIPVTWHRPSLEQFFSFTDANGSPISLKPGNTWFELAPAGYVPTAK